MPLEGEAVCAQGGCEEGAAGGAGGEELGEEGGVYDADDGLSVEEEGDADAEGGEEVDVVYGAVEGVDAPGGGVGNEVVAGGAFGVGFFADEAGGLCQCIAA